MFVTVEDGGNKCVVTGTLHYSLVGERALFRVCTVQYYNNRKREKVISILWVSK